MPHKQFLPRMKYSNHPTQSQVRARTQSQGPLKSNGMALPNVVELTPLYNLSRDIIDNIKLVS